MLKKASRAEDGLSKDEKKTYAKHYQTEITTLQQKLKEAKIPVIILVEGQTLSGKSTLVNQIISELDPRFAAVFVEADLGKKTLERPFIEPFFNAIPENGKIMIYDGAWAAKTCGDYVKGDIGNKEFECRIAESNRLERQLVNNGYLLIKFFLNVDKERQKKNYKALSSDDHWTVNKKVKKQVEAFDDYLKAYNKFILATNDVRWNILCCPDEQTLYYDAFKIILDELNGALNKGKFNGKPYKESFPMVKMPKLKDVDLSFRLERNEYKKQLKAASDRLRSLESEVAKKGITTLIAFEGWDAAGKGSAIRRLVYPLDPRLFTVFPIASPEPSEKNRHHLWRFWKRMPQNGHFAIFDRTWYGRVMVERLEGFCTENDWKRAYAEMNEFEQTLSDWGAVIIKFWIQIDKDTQLARFTDRQNTPEKQWKITDEDWRNREKWDLYEVAIDDMIQKTSTKFAPWTIVEGNDKLYARIKIINTVCDRLEKALKEK